MSFRQVDRDALTERRAAFAKERVDTLREALRNATKAPVVAPKPSNDDLEEVPF